MRDCSEEEKERPEYRGLIEKKVRSSRHQKITRYLSSGIQWVSVFGKSPRLGSLIVLLICTSGIWSQCPVPPHPAAPQGVPRGAAVAAGLMVGMVFPPGSLRAHCPGSWKAVAAAAFVS